MENRVKLPIIESLTRPIKAVFESLVRQGQDMDAPKEILFTDLSPEKPWYKQPFTIMRNLLVALSEGL